MFRQWALQTKYVHLRLRRTSLEELRSRYEAIGSKFPKAGFNVDTISHLAKLFKMIDVDGKQKIWARMYEEVGHMNPCVRLLVLPLPERPLRAHLYESALNLFNLLPS